MDNSDLESEGLFYTTDGIDIWKMEGFFRMPSCTLRNLETNETEIFGMGGLIAQTFHKLIIPQKALKEEK